MLNSVMPKLKEQSLYDIYNLVEEYEIRNGPPNWNFGSSSRAGNTAPADRVVLTDSGKMEPTYVDLLERMKREQDQLKLKLDAMQKTIEKLQYQAEKCPDLCSGDIYRQNSSEHRHVVAPLRRIDLRAFELCGDFDIKQIAQEQQADPDLQLLYELKQMNAEKPSCDITTRLSEAAQAYFHNWHRIDIDSNGVLYLQCTGVQPKRSRHQILLPWRQRFALRDMQHGTGVSEHLGRRRALRKMQQNFYWYQMSRDICAWRV